MPDPPLSPHFPSDPPLSLPFPALHISYTDTLSSWTGTSDSMEFTKVSTCFFRKGGRATGNEKDELVLLVNITPSFLHWRTTQLKQTASCPGREDIKKMQSTSTARVLSKSNKKAARVAEPALFTCLLFRCLTVCVHHSSRPGHEVRSHCWSSLRCVCTHSYASIFNFISCFAQSSSFHHSSGECGHYLFFRKDAKIADCGGK